MRFKIKNVSSVITLILVFLLAIALVYFLKQAKNASRCIQTKECSDVDVQRMSGLGDMD